MSHPFMAPLYTGPHPPFPPGLSPEEQAQNEQMLKWSNYSKMAMESCVVKGALAGGIGFGLGAFISLMSTSMAYEDPFRNMSSTMSGRQKTIEVFKDMGKGMWRSGKGFGKVGGIYSVSECAIESYRAKHDMTNAVAGGFVAGAVLAYSSGPKGAMLGGLAFAAFSTAIELFLNRETKDDD